MIALNLTAKGAEQEIVKKHLEESVSESLAEKINNGVRIEKDGKVLINRKTLDGFMKYANEEARKQAGKGATSACIIVEYSLKTHKILQCYADHNTKPAPEVTDFVLKKWLPYANRKLKKIAA